MWAKRLWAMFDEPLLIPDFHASGPSVVDFLFQKSGLVLILKNELHFSKIRFVSRTFLESHGLYIYIWLARNSLVFKNELLPSANAS